MVKWERVEGGEYNQHDAEVNGQLVSVCSDRDGEHWYCYVGDEHYPLEAQCRDDALREAESIASET